MRDLLLFKSAPSLGGLLERARVDESFKELTEQVSNEWIQEAIMELNECQQEIKWSNSPKVFIEIAIITITNRYQKQESTANVADAGTVTKLTSKLDQLEKEIANLKQQSADTAQPAPRREVQRTQARSSKNSFKVPYEKIRNVVQQAEKNLRKEIQGRWASFLSQLKMTNAPAHATIQDSKPVAASEEAVVVAFKYEIHCSLFLDNRQTVESVLNSVMGKALTIIPIPEKAWQEVRSEYINHQDHAATKEEEQKSDPIVDQARELVGEDLLEIHD
jgi:DNA polymerase-3 subunit gamma/tau